MLNSIQHPLPRGGFQVRPGMTGHKGQQEHDGNADSIGDEVGPEEALTEHHVADES